MRHRRQAPPNEQGSLPSAPPRLGSLLSAIPVLLALAAYICIEGNPTP